MKALLVTLLILCSITTSAIARLGETEEQLTVRFGQGSVPVSSQGGWCQQQTFQKHGFTIMVTLVNGLSGVEEYHLNRGDVTTEQAHALLAIHSQGHKWVDFPQDIGTVKAWKRDDGGATALWDSTYFRVWSKQYDDAQTAFKKVQEPSLEGF